MHIFCIDDMRGVNRRVLILKFAPNAAACIFILLHRRKAATPLLMWYIRIKENLRTTNLLSLLQIRFEWTLHGE